LFCCFSQISFGQVDTLLYETFDNGIPSDWYNVDSKWVETTGGVRFEPSPNSERGELIMPNISIESNDSIILELDHNFICDPTKNDSLYIDVSYDGGVSYKNRLFVEDWNNPVSNLTKEFPNITNNDSITLKYVAILHENTIPVKWDIDKVSLYRQLGGNYVMTAQSGDVTGQQRLASIPIDCLPSNDNIPINLTLINKEDNELLIPVSAIELKITSVEQDIDGYPIWTTYEESLINIVEISVNDNIETTEILIGGDTEIEVNLTVNLGILNINTSESNIVKLNINISQFNSYDNEVQIDQCCQDQAITISANVNLPLLTASQISIETEEASIDETESIIIVSTNEIVYFEAAEFVSLNPGFETATDIGNGEFIAYIDDCELPSATTYKSKSKLADGKKLNLSLYPNPTDNIFHIEYYLENDSQVNASLFDMTGKLREEFIDNEFNLKGHQKTTFNMETLSSGLYLLKVQTDTWEKNVKVLKL